MDGIWAVLVFILSSTWAQDSSRTLFLISSPEVMHAGTSTSLAVTVHSDFSGKVTAEATHGNAKVDRTEDFQGGLTTIVTLPPLLGSKSQDSLVKLTVTGYREDSLVFTNTTTLRFNPSNVSSFIHTDRTHYRPGEAVKVRIVSVQVDERPYKGRVEVSLQDPSGNIIDRRESAGNLGIVLQEFTLSQSPPVGQWAITTSVTGVTDVRTFTVEHYEHPPFEVLIKTPSQLLVGDDISGSVRALYPSGQPVQGTLSVSVRHNSSSPFMLTQTKEIYGSTQFFFGNDLLLGVLSVHVAVSVTDSSTGFKVNRTAEVHLLTSSFQLSFHSFTPALKPSLLFFTTLRISRCDRKPLSLQDLTYSAVIEVTQRTSATNAKATTLTPPVPEDGNVHVQFKLQDQVEMLFIRARFQSSEETLTVYNNHSSPSGSYVQISPVDTLPAQVGLPLQIDVTSTFQPALLHFVVSSGGQVVAAGTKPSSSFTVIPTLSWSPEACFTVYCILSDGEVISDTAFIPINQRNQVSLSWSSAEAQPGERVSLTVAALEQRSQVGIVVTGSRDDAPQAHLDSKVEQECNIRMLTNARLHQKNQPNGPSNGAEVLMVERYWSLWMDTAESLLWLDTDVSGKTWTSGEITVPDGFTSLRAAALVMSDDLGLSFTPELQKLTVSKAFSLSLDVPSYLIRGEEIVLEVKIINHLEHDIEVMLLVSQSEAFEFVLANDEDMLVVNAQEVTSGSHEAASALFPIRPVALGHMEISVDAVSAEASDSLVWRALVKPEGVERSFSETLFLEMDPARQNTSRSVSFSFPPDVVPGSRRAHVALVGDILALSISNLDLLVQKPLGCGEQNMINFAPSIYIMQFLDKSNQDHSEIRSKALGYMMEGYQRELSYRRSDGSFSAFGASDSSGSTWLTAFVLKCFLQAQSYTQVDQSFLTGAVTWLLKHQGPQGEFTEVGRLIHTEMQGGMDDGPVALTAYVLMALLEDDSYMDKYSGNVSLAKTYLETKVSGGGISNYSLCLVAYALSLANSPLAGAALAELSSRADHRDGVMMWRSSAGLESRDWQPRSAQIEMASYMLLAFYRRGSLVEGIELMKWLSRQRNHLGGYGTTQDTVVALQALACYAAFSGASAIDLRLNISSPASSFVSLFSINATSYLTYQTQEIHVDKDLQLNIYMEGRGFAVFQINIFYNLESKAFSQSLQHVQDEKAFSLDVAVAEESDHDHLLLSVCTRLQSDQVIPHTGMVILDVGMLSGFRLSPGAAAPTHLIRKVDELPEKVSLYLDSLNKSEVCITLPIIRQYKVALVQDAVIRVYDYYEPTREATRLYNSAAVHHMTSCWFCGGNCDGCRPGLAITAPYPLISVSTSCSACSLMSLFLGVIASFIVV